jgi:hypothetical protein
MVLRFVIVGKRVFLVVIASVVFRILRLLGAGVLGVVSLAEFKDIYRYLKVNKFLADSTYDAYPFYELCEFWGIEPFIDLNSKGKGERIFLGIAFWARRIYQASG